MNVFSDGSSTLPASTTGEPDELANNILAGTGFRSGFSPYEVKSKATKSNRLGGLLFYSSGLPP